ncbi:unnamed protein product [Ectocarpus sp. 6 AP-2014]
MALHLEHCLFSSSPHRYAPHSSRRQLKVILQPSVSNCGIHSLHAFTFSQRGFSLPFPPLYSRSTAKRVVRAVSEVGRSFFFPVVAPGWRHSFLQEKIQSQHAFHMGVSHRVSIQNRVLLGTLTIHALGDHASAGW